MKVFGCPIIARLPGKRPDKLDAHAAMGVFLGYTATDNNINYQDTATKKKIATHVTFDEAGYTLPPAALSQTQRQLQFCAYKDSKDVTHNWTHPLMTRTTIRGK